jgi:transcriptional regulator with XRE-family HTH domain
MSVDELKQKLNELSALCGIHGRQKQIAREMGVSEQALSNWLNGSRSPSLESFFKIRDFLQKQKTGRKKSSRN